MIIFGCIEFHSRGCAWWIIVMKLWVLLITHYPNWEILVEAVFDVHVRCVKKKKILDLDVVTILFYKRVHEKIFVLVCTQRTICSLRDYCRKDGWVNL